VARGDRLLIQGNRKAAGLINGQLVTVQAVKRNGALELENGQTIPPDFRQFTHGHAVTSQTAQGRTVDHAVVVLQHGSLAAHEKMLYVAASRGRERVRIVCDAEETLDGR
jgi:ATP-dependent exoDNAse (exonuclease V) alpha subunit